MTDGKLYVLTALASAYLLAWYAIGAPPPRVASSPIGRIEARAPGRLDPTPRVVRASRPLRVRTRSS